MSLYSRVNSVVHFTAGPLKESIGFRGHFLGGHTCDAAVLDFPEPGIPVPAFQGFAVENVQSLLSAREPVLKERVNRPARSGRKEVSFMLS